MGDDAVPVRIGHPPAVDATAAAVGRDVAAVVKYHLAVLDREDRLEVGTGEWLAGIRADPAVLDDTARESVLRALRLAFDASNHPILEAIDGSESRTMAELEIATGLSRLTLAERVSDLVSAGLASRIPEADQVRATPAALAVVRLVREAAAVAAREIATER